MLGDRRIKNRIESSCRILTRKSSPFLPSQNSLSCNALMCICIFSWKSDDFYISFLIFLVFLLITELGRVQLTISRRFVKDGCGSRLQLKTSIESLEITLHFLSEKLFEQTYGSLIFSRNLVNNSFFSGMVLEKFITFPVTATVFLLIPNQ